MTSPVWNSTDGTEQLLAIAGAGDPRAVNQLLQRHRESLRRLVGFRLNRDLARRVDASDVVQDVLLEAATRLPDYLREQRLPFHLWLRQLARDRIIEMHRQHRLAAKRSIDRERPIAGGGDDCSVFEFSMQLADSELTPAAATLRKELENRFLLAIEQLEEDDRDIILMRHFEHLGNQEVAKSLNLSPPAAGMRYLRALRRLKSLLGGDDTSAPEIKRHAP